MTREEAIYVLKNTAWIGTNVDMGKTEQAVDMATDALTEEEPDGCFGCRYEFQADGLPCAECRNNYLSKYEPKRSDLISRADLFNALATIHAPMEANEYKAEVYKIINEL